MRVHKKKHGAERLEACGNIVIKDLRAEGNSSQKLFGNDKPLRIEIGCGKGDFIVGTAAKEPDVNFLAVEKVSDVLVIAAEKVKASGLDNVRVCCIDAKELTEIFEPHSIDRIYLNFSDPWPKARHEKRRLTYRSFLEIYKQILREDGAIYFKTDNRGLFDFSLEEFKEFGIRMEKLTFDLHNSEYMEGNVMTEYEKRFSSMGVPINRVECYFK
ncbi:MAG: tRNA (guanosine(46)-N7)-methyltransferase TrmB [Clostridia bacterium]|jgi:tRNA (guanine-N7-)-methyltransferase|nr:tRNA (guanosine(46)-N7)-methyltransferase TrmB [Clostridia bacterium]